MSEGVTQSFLNTFAPAIHISRSETQRVGCPYCPGGYTEVTAVHTGEKMEIPGFKDPHACVVCKRYFKLVPRVQVVGEAMEGE
jgi:hypothetical protein